MTGPVTLQGLLERSGARVHAYDLGRRIGAIDPAMFARFELGTTPYPTPMQRQAWFALVQRVPEADAEPVIWFLRLHLDEQGLLVQAERDYLLHRLLESAQARAHGADPQVFLRDNPHAFTPRDDRMALFHARVGADLGLPPSRFYRHALDYFGGGPGWEQWGFVGYQGIADVACRHGDEPLVSALPHLPREPLTALCHCLESGRVSTALADALVNRLREATQDEPPDSASVAALVRGLASAAARPAVVDALKVLLGSPAGADIEVLAALSGRSWEALHDPDLLQAYLQRLAESDHGQAAFEHAVGDLLSLPDLAATVRTALRAPGQSASVRLRFERMTAAPDGPA